MIEQPQNSVILCMCVCGFKSVSTLAILDKIVKGMQMFRYKPKSFPKNRNIKVCFAVIHLPVVGYELVITTTKVMLPLESDNHRSSISQYFTFNTLFWS